MPIPKNFHPTEQIPPCECEWDEKGNLVFPCPEHEKGGIMTSEDYPLNQKFGETTPYVGPPK